MLACVSEALPNGEPRGRPERAWQVERMLRAPFVGDGEDVQLVASLAEHCLDLRPSAEQRRVAWRSVGNDDQAGIGGHLQDVLVVVGPDRVVDLEQARLVGGAVGEGIGDQDASVSPGPGERLASGDGAGASHRTGTDIR